MQELTLRYRSSVRQASITANRFVYWHEGTLEEGVALMTHAREMLDTHPGIAAMDTDALVELRPCAVRTGQPLEEQ